MSLDRFLEARFLCIAASSSSSLKRAGAVSYAEENMAHGCEISDMKGEKLVERGNEDGDVQSDNTIFVATMSVAV
jgi:hypothetical protein